MLAKDLPKFERVDSNLAGKKKEKKKMIDKIITIII